MCDLRYGNFPFPEKPCLCGAGSEDGAWFGPSNLGSVWTLGAGCSASSILRAGWGRSRAWPERTGGGAPTCLLLSASVGRGQYGGRRSVSREPDRAGPSRRPGGAMWFMYVLSWLSLFIQVAFITLAVGESADPGREHPGAPSCQPLLCFAAGCGRPRAGPAGPRPNLPEGMHGLRDASLLSGPWAAPSTCPL